MKTLKRKNLDSYFSTIRKKQGKENLTDGYNYEHQIFLMEQQNSIFTMKSAGSRGEIDIISVKKKETQHIVVKRNSYLSPTERKKLNALDERLPRGHKIYVYSEYFGKIPYINNNWKRGTK